MDVIQKTLDKKQVVVCNFINIEGAFDNTSHETVKTSLEKKGVDSVQSRWMYNLLYTRKLETKVGERTI